jgi:hypothetical protein
MKKFFLYILFSITGLNAFSQKLTLEQAIKLARLPMHCINTEYPNKTSHLINDSVDAVMTPAELHPSFYGCLDWHSSVHGHWMLVRILKEFPEITLRDSIINVLHNSFDEEKIKEEADYFVKFKNSNTWERTYGWAWLLKLDQELLTSDDPATAGWHESLQPLTQKIVSLWKEYLTKQTYPNRTGVHPNTAFGLVFALDWARAVKDTSFEAAVIRKANDFYLDNTNTPAYLEPDGTDFLSPSLEIADLMSRILPRKEFAKWFNRFYKPESIENIVKLPVVSDRTDFQIVHLDGLTLSRAWCMKGLARALPENHRTGKLFAETSKMFIDQALPNVLSGNYGGEHWLASFAVYALSL